jgi:hypothetical protein
MPKPAALVPFADHLVGMGLAAVAVVAVAIVAAGGCAQSQAGSDAQICSDYCADLFACLSTNDCVFADATAAQAACAAACESSFDQLSSGDANTVRPCITCETGALGAGECLFDVPDGTCDAPCMPAAAAVATWSAGFSSGPPDPNVICTNGFDPLTAEDCPMTESGNACTISCCNGPCGATPVVAATCEMPPGGNPTCTCTAGKNKGQPYAGIDCDITMIWNGCNL